MHKKEREQMYRADDGWLDRLDEIATGEDEPLPGDDELLHIAGQLAAAFAPLRELDAPTQARRHHLRMQLRGKAATSHSRKKWLVRPLVAAAAILLFVLLGPGLIFEMNLAGKTAQNLPNSNSSAPGWAAASLPSDLSFAILPVKDFPRGQTLLLPTTLAPNAYLLATSISNYGSSAPINLYLIYTQNARIYESPSAPVAIDANPTYSTVQIGQSSGIVLHTSDDENRIEWYQAGLLCDMVSKEPVPAMVTTIEQLQTVKL